MARVRRPAAAAGVLLVYFLVNQLSSLDSYFTGDDVMNAHYYSAMSAGQWTDAAWRLFLGVYRPAGALVYLPALEIFGFQPAPLHLLLMALRGIEVLLWFGLCCRWVSAPTAFLAAGAFAFHGSMTELRYNAGTLYDTLAVLFALVGARLFCGWLDGWREWWRPPAFALVTWLGISSKEHFAAFPVILCAVLLMEGRWPCRPTLKAVAFTGVSVLGAAWYRWSHDDMLLRLDPYTPRLDMTRIGNNLDSYWYLTRLGSARVGAVLAILLVASAAAGWLDRKRWVLTGSLLWAAAAMAPLLVIPARSGFVLYLAWAGGSLALARSLDLLRRWPAVAGVTACLLLWQWTHAGWRMERSQTHLYTGNHRVNRNFAGMLPMLPDHSPERPLLLITTCWMQDQWEPWFIARLAGRGREIHMDRAPALAKAPRPARDYSAILSFDGERLAPVTSPSIPAN